MSGGMHGSSQVTGDLSGDEEQREYSAELSASPGLALRHLRQAAEEWGGRCEADRTSPASRSHAKGDGSENLSSAAGRLAIPVMAGLRRGWVAGTFELLKTGGGSRLTFNSEESNYRIELPAFLFLLLAGVGALITLLGPFIPVLLPFFPMGALLGVAAWFFIISKLRNSGPEEFLADVSGRLEEQAAGE